jgi:hypothetical protein
MRPLTGERARIAMYVRTRSRYNRLHATRRETTFYTGLREKAVRMLRESREWRRATGEQLRRVYPWLLLVLFFNVFGWLVASYVVKP